MSTKGWMTFHHLRQSVATTRKKDAIFHNREVIINHVISGAKRSPPRFRLGGPGPFRDFQTQKSNFSFFWAFVSSKMHSSGSPQNTSPLNILVLAENTFILQKIEKSFEPLVSEFFFVAKNLRSL